MKYILILTTLIITGCASHAPQPLSWSSELDSVKAEPINKDVSSIQSELIKSKKIWEEN